MAQYTVEKLLQLGAKPVTLSDSDGTIYDPDGINAEKLAYVMELKNVRRGRIKEYAEKFGARYVERQRPWAVPCDCAFPSATQNEITGEDAKIAAQERLQACLRRRQHAVDARGGGSLSRRPRFSTARARRPTRAAWPPPVWRCRRIPCA